MKLIAAIAICSTLNICASVDIKARGVEYNDGEYLLIVHSAPTKHSDQSGAKINAVNVKHVHNKTDDDVESILLFDRETKYMPIDLFYKFKNTKYFHVLYAGQEMEAPTNGHFANGRKLERIFITNQVIRKLGSHVFEGARDISWIYLEHDLIDTVDEATFKDLKTLDSLSLQSNLIKMLRKETFSTLVSLEFLNLNNNLLTTLPPQLFAGNKKLKTLFLSVNRLLHLEPMELPVSLISIQVQDNFCIDAVFHSLTDFLNGVEEACSIGIDSLEIIDRYKDQLKKHKNCDASDMAKILELKKQIKEIEGETEVIEMEKEKLSETLDMVPYVQVCLAKNDMDF